MLLSQIHHPPCVEQQLTPFGHLNRPLLSVTCITNYISYEGIYYFFLPTTSCVFSVTDLYFLGAQADARLASKRAPLPYSTSASWRSGQSCDPTLPRSRCVKRERRGTREHFNTDFKLKALIFCCPGWTKNWTKNVSFCLWSFFVGALNWVLWYHVKM